MGFCEPDERAFKLTAQVTKAIAAMKHAMVINDKDISCFGENPDTIPVVHRAVEPL